jgi:hypothetical protein
LKAFVASLERGEFDSDLGAGVYKKRLARPGGGKSGGYRIIVYFKNRFRTFFVYGFAKSDKANIPSGRLNGFKKLAKKLLAMSNEQLEAVLAAGNYKEIQEE